MPVISAVFPMGTFTPCDPRLQSSALLGRTVQLCEHLAAKCRVQKLANDLRSAIRTTSITRPKPIEPDIVLDRASAETHLGLPTRGSDEASPFCCPSAYAWQSE